MEKTWNIVIPKSDTEAQNKQMLLGNGAIDLLSEEWPQIFNS